MWIIIIVVALAIVIGMCKTASDKDDWDSFLGH